VNGLQVNLGGGGTISTIADGVMLWIGLGHSVIANNIALHGRPNNNTSVVDVYNGGVFQMETGSTIRGNGRGAVYVDSGTLIMRGGIIRDNSRTTGNERSGGGVLVENSGTFIMHNGSLITSNSASGGGGVFVANNSIFIMEGGIISDNTSSGSGGAVAIDRGSNFTMNNGELSNNRTTTGGGGGVSLQRNGRNTFTLNGGTIRDNTTTGSGGGVGAESSNLWGDNSGIFVMNGGLIINNAANGGNGGGVYRRSSQTFTKTGGNISGNTSSGQGKTAFSDNFHAGQRSWRNTNAGPNNNTADADFWLNDD
jgi:hypothetical protein